jgi:sec-independent protein translocase protein TatC
MNKYFKEIKNRLFLLLITWFSTLIITYFYKETLLFNILYQNGVNFKNKHFNTFYFIFTNITEILSVYIEVIFFSGFQMLFLHFIYHVFIFLVPAFFKTEYFRLKTFLKWLLSIYFVSFFFFFYLILPITINFFIEFQKLTIYLHFEAKIIEYLNFLMFLYYGCLFYLQFVTFLFLIIDFFITPRIIKGFRKLFYYLFLILTTLICPPEILIQITINLFIIIFYELIILFFLLKLKCYYLQR